MEESRKNCTSREVSTILGLGIVLVLIPILYLRTPIFVMIHPKRVQPD